ncbi:MAG TPA: Ig-like domain-containing protein [bacterium]|nr:Ig-like domain-containing protein [bacterium]
MRKALIILWSLLVLASMGQDPDNIIVKYDTAYGGSYLSSAISDLWPSCSATYYDGSTWSTFISSLTGGDWDMCIVAAINYTSYTTSDYTALTNWYNDFAKLHYFDWYAHGSYNDALETAMGVGNPTSMVFTASHYCWDLGHAFTYGITSWTLDDHGWGLSVYHHRYPWTTAHPVTGWTATETAGQAGILEAENGMGVVTGLYESFIGGGQEQQLWENVLTNYWIPNDPPYVTGMDPDDGDTGVPVDTNIVFHCVDDFFAIDLDTIDFTARDTTLSGGRAVSASAAISANFESARSIAGDLDLDDTDPRDVVCTFTPADPLNGDDAITCTVAAGLANRYDIEMEEDFVWSFTTEELNVVQTSWGAIKAEF